MKIAYTILVLLALGILLMPLPARAATTATVVITVVGTTGGINGFTITYINDKDMLLTWSLAGDASKIMIRAKYGGYPTNIPDKNTTPSDGYLVYYGSGTSIDDTSMDFDQNAGSLYYEAWAQRADGTWHTDIQQGLEESKELLLIGFIVLAIGITWFSFKWHNILMTLVSMLCWLAPGIWVFMGGNASLSISNTYTIYVLFIFIVMTFVPLVQYIGRVGKTEIAINRNGQTYSLWGKPEVDHIATDSERQSSHRAKCRESVERGIEIRRQKGQTKRRRSRTSRVQ